MPSAVCGVRATAAAGAAGDGAVSERLGAGASGPKAVFLRTRVATAARQPARRGLRCRSRGGRRLRCRCLSRRSPGSRPERPAPSGRGLSGRCRGRPAARAAARPHCGCRTGRQGQRGALPQLTDQRRQLVQILQAADPHQRHFDQRPGLRALPHPGHGMIQDLHDRQDRLQAELLARRDRSFACSAAGVYSSRSPGRPTAADHACRGSSPAAARPTAPRRRLR